MILTPWLGNNEIPGFATDVTSKICYRIDHSYYFLIKHEQKSLRLWQVEFALANNSFGPQTTVYKASEFYVVILCNLRVVQIFGFYDHIDYFQRTFSILLNHFIFSPFFSSFFPYFLSFSFLFSFFTFPFLSYYHLFIFFPFLSFYGHNAKNF